MFSAVVNVPGAGDILRVADHLPGIVDIPSVVGLSAVVNLLALTA